MLSQAKVSHPDVGPAGGALLKRRARRARFKSCAGVGQLLAREAVAAARMAAYHLVSGRHHEEGLASYRRRRYPLRSGKRAQVPMRFSRRREVSMNGLHAWIFGIGPSRTKGGNIIWFDTLALGPQLRQITMGSEEESSPANRLITRSRVATHSLQTFA
jgi:hypothetical protein